MSFAYLLITSLLHIVHNYIKRVALRVESMLLAIIAFIINPCKMAP
jgi:hypothetical protein